MSAPNWMQEPKQVNRTEVYVQAGVPVPANILDDPDVIIIKGSDRRTKTKLDFIVDDPEKVKKVEVFIDTETKVDERSPKVGEFVRKYNNWEFNPTSEYQGKVTGTAKEKDFPVLYGSLPRSTSRAITVNT